MAEYFNQNSKPLCLYRHRTTKFHSIISKCDEVTQTPTLHCVSAAIQESLANAK